MLLLWTLPVVSVNCLMTGAHISLAKLSTFDRGLLISQIALLVCNYVHRPITAVNCTAVNDKQWCINAVQLWHVVRCAYLNATNWVQSAVDGVGNDSLDISQHQCMWSVNKVRDVALWRRLQTQLTVTCHWSVQHHDGTCQPTVVYHLHQVNTADCHTSLECTAPRWRLSADRRISPAPGKHSSLSHVTGVYSTTMAPFRGPSYITCTR